MRYALVLLLIALPCEAQTITGEAGASLSLWGQSQAYYQHAIDVDGEVTGRWGPVSATVYGAVKMWGAGRYKSDGNRANPLTAEGLRALERQQGVKLMFHVERWSFGAQIHRTATQHVWAHKDVESRHDHFPVNGNGWREAKKRCIEWPDDREVAVWAHGKCPGIGYWEKLGARVAYDGPRVGASVSVMPIQYKTLTLPPLAAFGSLRVTITPEWSASLEWEVSTQRHVYGDVALRRDIGPVYLEMSGGRVKAPDWTSRFWRWGVRVGI